LRAVAAVMVAGAMAAGAMAADTAVVFMVASTVAASMVGVMHISMAVADILRARIMPGAEHGMEGTAFETPGSAQEASETHSITVAP
jgi:hypothetical protein